MTTPLAQAVLAAGVDDWVPLRAIDGLARQLDRSANEERLQRNVLDTVVALVGSDLVEVGEVSDGGFFAWNEPTTAWLTRIERAYEGGDADQWGFVVWVSNTSRGDEIGRAVLAGEGHDK